MPSRDWKGLRDVNLQTVGMYLQPSLITTVDRYVEISETRNVDSIVIETHRQNSLGHTERCSIYVYIYYDK
jgi:hypothetical protein